MWFIGWDVGAWHCDKGNSRDAIVILDANREIAGTPWRGNLRACINRCTTATKWIETLFNLCRSGLPAKTDSVTLAIDAPLRFPDSFIELMAQNKVATSIEEFKTNPYLFRRTERFLFEQGFMPSSAIQDSLGSQATKGMHILARFAPKIEQCGVWSGGSILTAIETYPAACKKSKTIQTWRQSYNHPKLANEDCRDALVCALVARLFARNQGDLMPPDTDASSSEGWIWVPKDAFDR